MCSRIRTVLGGGGCAKAAKEKSPQSGSEDIMQL